MRVRRRKKAIGTKRSTPSERSSDIICISSDEDIGVELSGPPKRQRKSNRNRNVSSVGQPAFIWISDEEDSFSRDNANASTSIMPPNKDVCGTLLPAVSVADPIVKLPIEKEMSKKEDTEISDRRKSFVPTCLQDPQYDSYYGKYSVFFTPEDPDPGEDEFLEELIREEGTNYVAGGSNTSKETLLEGTDVENNVSEVISDDEMTVIDGKVNIDKTIIVDDDQGRSGTSTSIDAPVTEVNHAEKIHLLNVWFRIKNIKFEIKTFEPIRNLMEYLVKTEGADYDAMIPLYKDEKIGPLDTPYHLNFETEETIDFIYGRKQDHFEFFKYKIGDDEIVLKVQGSNKKDGVESIRINKYHTLGVLYRLYAERRRLAWNSFKLCFDGDTIDPNDTAEDLGMGSEDIVDCC